MIGVTNEWRSISHEIFAEGEVVQEWVDAHKTPEIDIKRGRYFSTLHFIRQRR